MTSLARAETLFKRFHKRAPADSEIVEMSLAGAPVAIEIGKISELLYSVTGQKKLRRHRFKEKNAPRLFVSADGRNVFAVGGDVKFSARGFLG